MSADENRLVERAKGGDPDAFGELYRLHQPTIYRFVYYRVGNTAAAEDLTSEVFVRLVERIDRFEMRGRPLLAWLYTIARNLVTDHYRREARTRYLPLDDGLKATNGDPVRSADAVLMRERLLAALDTLTLEQRDVLFLRFFEDLDSGTVAQIMGKSVGAIKALQHRALASMARTMGQEYGHPK